MLISPQKEAEALAVDAERADGRRRAAALRFVVQFAVMLAVLAVSFVAMNHLIDARPEREPRVFEPTVYAVEATTVRVSDNRPQISLFGDVVTARSVDLRAQVTGEIVDVNPRLSAGERIEAGALIARIDPFQYEGALAEAEANLAQAQAARSEIEARIAAEREQLDAAELQLSIAESDLDRAQSLSERGAATQQQIDERRLVVSQRQQAVSQSRNNLVVEQARLAQQEATIDSLEWAVRQATRNLANTEITAPLSGVVSEATAEVGRIVGSSDVIASIYDDSMLEARFTLTDAQYGRLVADEEPLIGRPVEARWTVGQSDYVYDGVIDRIAATVASDRGGVEVFARLEESGDGEVALRPGAFVEVTLADRLYPETVRLPESALYDTGHVFLIEDGELVRREVDVRAFAQDDVIVAGDLAAGDEVLTTRLTEADEGLPVRIVGNGTAASDGIPAGTAAEAGE